MFKTALLKAVWEQSRNHLIVVGLLILISIGLFVYQIQFVDPEVEDLRSRQGELQKQLRAREKESSESSVPVSEVEKMMEDLLKFSKLVPEKQNFADFVGDLFSWAERSELDIRQVSYQPKVDSESKFLVYGLNFSVEGSYGQLKKFIHLLENSKRILIIDKISMTGAVRKDNSSSVRLQINMSTVFREGAK